jgi:putative ABC transport system permease protein
MLSRIRKWLGRRDDVSEELAFHFHELKQERLSAGDTEAEADRFARRKLGNRTAVQETIHEMSALRFFEPGARHLLFALRSLFRYRGAYLSAIGILALGIGMSVAMFSLADAVLLRPLPFPEQGSIQVIWKTDPAAGASFVELAYPELRDLQENIPGSQYVAVMPTTLYGYGKVLQTGNAEPVQVESTPVSHDYFRVLGVSPVLGRDFTSSDEQVGAAPVAMISDWVWREHLGANRNIVGQMIRLNGQGHTVIGVMARGVDFPRGAGLWIPLGVDRRVVERRTATFLQAIVRVKRGYSRASLTTQVNTLFARLAADHPDAYTPSQQAVVTPIAEYWTGSARLHLWIMLGASLLLLIAATISAGNLFLSRAMSRRQEIATRAALGAGPAQILLQFAAEGIVAGAIAAFGGLLMAQLAIRFLVKWSPGDIPRLSEAALNVQSFGFAASVALLAAIVCSILPGWFITRTNLEAALRTGGARSTVSRTGGRTQSAFVFAQAAVTAMLLLMAGLLVMSYHSMMTADTGFANHDAVSMNVALRGPGLFGAQAYDLKARHAFYSRLLDRLREATGVTSAAAVLLRPFEGAIGWDAHYRFEFESNGEGRSEPPQANFEAITPGYFQTVGTPLLEGRDFNEHDGEGIERVAIIGNSLAQRIRDAGQNPIGHRLRLSRGPNGPWMRVIGVCGSARYRSVTQTGDDIFVPYLQSEAPTNYVVIRGSRPAEELAALVRHTLAGIDPNQAVAGVATLGSLIDRNTARHRFNMILLLWFGACAVILAAMGVYSVIAEGVAARRREIAIKTVLGARKPRLARDMVYRALVFVLAGEAVGVCCVAGLGRLGSELLYSVSPRDPVIVGSVLAFLFVVSLVSALWPAWTAAGRDPNAVLHET